MSLSTKDLSQFLRNPYSLSLKNYLKDILGNRNARNEDIIERICHFIATQKDVESFTRLLVDVYASGLHEAVRQNAEQLSEAGYEVKIVKTKEKEKEKEEIVKPKKPVIFSQPEKSG